MKKNFGAKAWLYPNSEALVWTEKMAEERWEGALLEAMSPFD